MCPAGMCKHEGDIRSLGRLDKIGQRAQSMLMEQALAQSELQLAGVLDQPGW